jgi:hypothetical protein
MRKLSLNALIGMKTLIILPFLFPVLLFAQSRAKIVEVYNSTQWQIDQNLPPDRTNSIYYDEHGNNVREVYENGVARFREYDANGHQILAYSKDSSHDRTKIYH